MGVETLAWGYGLIEGPTVDDDGGLFFSDVPNGGVYRLTPDGTVETVVPKRRGVGGITRHADGGLVLSGRNVCHVRDGQTRVLLEREGVGGFNDLTADDAGRVYVGSLRSDPFALEGERTPGEAYRLDPGGGAVELYGGVGLTNGFGVSPAGDRLYHADSAAGHVLVHDLAPDGSVSGRRVLAAFDEGVPDGLAVDEEGGVWVALYDGGCAVRLSPEGEVTERVTVPARAVTSVCFAAGGRRALWVVTADNTDHPDRGGTVFLVDVPVAGRPVPLARV